MNQKKSAIYYVILSTIGAMLLIVIPLFSASNINAIHIFDKLIVGGAFISSCILGISFAIKPNWIGRFIKRGRHDENEQQSHMKTRKRQGHHPDCEKFKSHVIKTKNKVICASCSGLAVGSLISIFLMATYIFIPSEIPLTILYIFIILGLIIIILNYIEIVIPTRNARIHVIFNALLVISFFLIIIGIFELTGSIIYGIFGVIISFLWLDTRILLSKWRHSEICKSCSETCKVY